MYWYSKVCVQVQSMVPFKKKLYPVCSQALKYSVWLKNEAEILCELSQKLLTLCKTGLNPREGQSAIYSRQWHELRSVTAVFFLL